MDKLKKFQTVVTFRLHCSYIYAEIKQEEVKKRDSSERVIGHKKQSSIYSKKAIWFYYDLNGEEESKKVEGKGKKMWDEIFSRLPFASEARDEIGSHSWMYGDIIIRWHILFIFLSHDNVIYFAKLLKIAGSFRASIVPLQFMIYSCKVTSWLSFRFLRRSNIKQMPHFFDYLNFISNSSIYSEWHPHILNSTQGNFFHLTHELFRLLFLNDVDIRYINCEFSMKKGWK